MEKWAILPEIRYNFFGEKRSGHCFQETRQKFFCRKLSKFFFAKNYVHNIGPSTIYNFLLRIIEYF
jgi:hypothetical protein